MIGWDMYLYPFMVKKEGSGRWRGHGQSRELVTPHQQQGHFVEWEEAAWWSPSNWLDELVATGLARILSGDGYPNEYAVSIEGFKSKLAAGIETKDSGNLKLSAEALEQLDEIGDAAWICLEQWDQS